MSSQPELSSWRDLQTKSKDLRYLQKMQELLEHRLHHLRGRADRVALIAGQIGRGADLNGESLLTLELGARYHDLGMLAIPDTLLEVERPLSPAERRLVEAHVRLGGQLLHVGYSDYPELLEIVWFHHERPDGQGPLGLRGELIPLPAAITSLAGAVESMYQGRPHRRPMSSRDIVEELHHCAGTQFDATVVRLFSRGQEEVFERLADLESRGGGEHAEVEPHLGGAGAGAAGGGTALGDSAAAPSAQPMDVSTRLRSIQRLTALPTSVCEVLMLAGNKYADRQELAKAIRQDVGLTAGVLGLANTSVYGPRRGRITTVEEAVTHVGFDAIKNLASGLAVLRNIGGEPEGTVGYVKLWEHSFATALIARLLAAEDPPHVRETRYVTGLLHDLGKFALVEFFPEQVPHLMQTYGLDQERKTVGIDHAHLGAKLLIEWGIPPEITQPVAEHHTGWSDSVEFGEGEVGPILTVQLADALALVLGLDCGFLDYLPHIPREIWRHCPAVRNVDPQKLGETLGEQMREMKMLLGMFEERPAGAPVEKTGPVNKPSFTYVTVEPLPLDFLALWLQHSRGLAVHHYRLDAQDEEKEPRSPIIVDLSSAEPRPGRVARLNDLLSKNNGLIVSSEAWAEHLPNASPGWQVLGTPLALRHLEAALRQALAGGGSAG